ncbi:hypothetical protein [Bacterioplanoides sp.]|uniref:hypothetical protein n=1 Tax=Bacterioplanoides sp. TaxID=2066072 RepID=UPI003B5C4C47
MSSRYPEILRKRHVADYQKQFRQTGITIENFSTQIGVHHTTVRQWLKRYAPDFYSSRRQTKTITQSVQVETEWYPDNQPEMTEPELSVMPDGPDDSDRISLLLKEIEFLKRQVIYWMRQDRIQI